MSDPLNPLGRVGGAATTRPSRRAGGVASGGAFERTLSGADEPPVPEARESAEVAGVNPVLLHELAVDAQGQRDRESHRHGTEILELLSELQRALLGAKASDVPLDRLLSLVESCPEAADPGLAAVTRAIVLRARIEIARRLPMTGR